MRELQWKSGDRQMSANALHVVTDLAGDGAEAQVADGDELPNLRPSYDLHGDPRAGRWFGGVVVEFASSGQSAPELHPKMMNTIKASLTGRHPRYIYDGGTMYLTFRLLSLAERPLVEEFAGGLERWLGRTASHRVFEHGPAQAPEETREGSVIRLR